VFPPSAEAIDQNSDTLTTGVGRLTIWQQNAGEHDAGGGDWNWGLEQWPVDKVQGKVRRKGGNDQLGGRIGGQWGGH